MTTKTTYTEDSLVTDITTALEGYMDINSIPFITEGTLEDLRSPSQFKGLVVRVEGKRFKIKVIPA
jgi:hypothetical protein